MSDQSALERVFRATLALTLICACIISVIATAMFIYKTVDHITHEEAKQCD